MQISIVIPAVNEEGSIGSTLSMLPRDVQIIVVDGGSTDRTCEIARERAVVVHSPRSRALQLNLGARFASGEILLFLHADSRLPARGLNEIRKAIQQGYAGGGFIGRFDSNHFAFRFGYMFRDLRTRILRELYGDQGIFVRRDIFERLGGYRPMPIMEDFEFVRRLRRSGPVKIIPYPIVMSARRYLRYGIFKQHLKNLWIRQRYILGADPGRLYPTYDRYWEHVNA